MVNRTVQIYDATLREGAQGQDISFSLNGKLDIARELDDLGVDYIEGGWIPSNPKDSRFFEEVEDLSLSTATVFACGSTRRPNTSAGNDKGLQALMDCGAPGIALVGKSWRLHVDQVLNTTPDENLDMIADSVRALKEGGKEVVYDAEHFFDGYSADSAYAIETLTAAAEAGADFISLCDTNGGTLPSELREVVRIVAEKVDVPLGIHAHDDSGLAVANSLAAVEEGVSMVQGTINGYGERVGNADLCSVIPDLSLKLGVDCLDGQGGMEKLSSVSHYVSEMANMAPAEKTPFVGRDAFAHKAGLHVDAVLKNPETFEHVSPETVGNQRRFLVSELSGKSTIRKKLENLGFDLDEEEQLLQEVLSDLKSLEEEGYQFENADASLELLANRIKGDLPDYFTVSEYEAKVARADDEEPRAEAKVSLEVEGQKRRVMAEGDGPVHALDNAFRTALNSFFPQINKMQLTDYKVRVLESRRGTAAKPRVMIEMSEGKQRWTTIGVSFNIIEASWKALRDGYIYGLMKSADKAEDGLREAEYTSLRR